MCGRNTVGRAEHTKLCALVVIGVNERGEKRSCRRSAPGIDTELARGTAEVEVARDECAGAGDWRLGANWSEVYGETRQQRSLMHWTMNVLTACRSQAKAKQRPSLLWHRDEGAEKV